MVISLTILLLLEWPMLQYRASFKVASPLVLKKKILKVLTTKRHVGHVCWTVQTTLCSLSPRRLYMNWYQIAQCGF